MTKNKSKNKPEPNPFGEKLVAPVLLIATLLISFLIWFIYN
jgi:hypothetical protein